MKIALLQCDVQTGNLDANMRKLYEMSQKAGRAGAVLCISPLAALAGPNPACYQLEPDFMEAYGKALSWLAERLKNGPALICGSASHAVRPILISGGMWLNLQNSFYFNDSRFCLCVNTLFTAGDAKVDVYILESSEPFAPGNRQMLESYSQAFAVRNSAWVVNANLNGGYGEAIYQGSSMAVTSEGRLAARGAAFSDDIIIFDTDQNLNEHIAPLPEGLEAQWDALLCGVRDFVHKSGHNQAIIGLSGGMDSALVCCVAAEALGPENTLAVLMPSRYSSQASLDDANELAANLGIKTFTIPIEAGMVALDNMLGPAFAELPLITDDLTEENIQPRLRGLILMAFANRTGGLVLNTGNRSEASMGYSTLYGDTVGAVSVLGDLFKTRIYELARWYNESKNREIIPENIFSKAPSAELKPEQKDTDSLPPYDELDPILNALAGHEEASDHASSEKMEQIRGRMFKFQFKRAQSPIPLLVSGLPLPKCPLAAKYNLPYLMDEQEEN